MHKRLACLFWCLMGMYGIYPANAEVEITINCPRQIPIKLDKNTLGGQWDQGKSITLRLYSSSLHRHGGLLRCHYRIPGGDVVTTIVRDYPKGFSCKTNSKGIFVCSR